MPPQDSYTTVHLKDGTTVHLKGQLSPDEIGPQLSAFQGEQKPVSVPPTGTISAYEPSAWDQIKSAVPVIGYGADVLSGRKSLREPMPLENVGQLAYPERVFTPGQQEAHPIRTAFDEFAGSLTSPDNILLMKGLGALGLAGRNLGKILPRVASGIFAGQMGKGSYEAGSAAWQNYQQYKATGDEKYKNEAERLGTHAVLGGLMATLSAYHAKHGTPAPKDSSIAASGKTETEAKTEAAVPQTEPSSPRTGLAPDDIHARIAKLRADIAAAEAKGPAKIESGEVPKTLANIPSVTKFLTPEVIDRAVKESKPEAPKGPTPEQELASLRAQRAQELKNLEIGLTKEGELKVRSDPKFWEEAAKSPDPAMRQLAEDRARTLQERIAAGKGPAPPEAPKVDQSKLEAKQAEMKARQQAVQSKQAENEAFIKEHRAAEAKEVARLKKENDALRAQAPVSPEVGGLPAPPEAAKPKEQPVQTPEPPKGPGESVRPASQSEVVEPRSMRGDLGERPPQPPAAKQALPDINVFRERVAKWQEEHPGVAKARAQEAVAEQMRKERGSLWSGGEGTPHERREAKINDLIKRLGDPKAKPEDLDAIYKRLTDFYDLSHDDIIKRMAGGADFAKTPLAEEDKMFRDAKAALAKTPPVDPRTGIPEASQEGLEERARDLERVKGELRLSGEELRKHVKDVYDFLGDQEAEFTGPEFKEFLRHLNEERKGVPWFNSLRPDQKMDIWTNFIEKGDEVTREINDRPGVGGIMDTVDRVMGKQKPPSGLQSHDDFMELLDKNGTTDKYEIRDILKKEGWSNPNRISGAGEAGTDRWRSKDGHELILKFDESGTLEESEWVPSKSISPSDPRLQENFVADQLVSNKVGEADIHGVMSPATEELERMFKLKDERAEKRNREGERGSLSFRRLTEAEKKEAMPHTRLFNAIANALDKFADVIEHPGRTSEQFANQQLTKNIIRQARAGKALHEAQIEHILEDMIKVHDNPVNERENFIKFMDAAEKKPGATFLQPMDQAVAEEIKDMFKARWPRIAAIKGWDEGDAVENYLGRIWDKPEKAEAILRGILTGKRPMEGTPRFTHERFYDYASEAMAHGLEPISWNPIRVQLAALFQMDKYLMAHEDIKIPLGEEGLVKWFTHGDQERPSHWTTINDKIFNPKIMKEGMLGSYGAWYAPPEVADIVNRDLSPGLEKSRLFRSIRNYSNRLNMVQLGISGYHGAMISWVSATSDVALGLQKVFKYGDVGGVKDILRGSVGSMILRSAANDYKLGKAIQAQAIDPGIYPSLQKYVDALLEGGARFRQDRWYTSSMSERTGFMNWLRLAKGGHFLQMADIGVRVLASPIMEKFVPRIKLGVGARMMEAKLRALDSQSIDDPAVISNEMGKIWDSVDNRGGQMVRDNLFWKKTALDISHVAIRAVGWDFGSIREYGGAVLVDTPRAAASLFRGKAPELTSRIAFTVATPITIGVIGGMIHYYMTGKPPRNFEDCMYPGPDGGKISWANYGKDFYNFKHAPLKTAINKLHPTWMQVYEGFWSNTDAFGTEIRHPGDPLLKQGYDVLKWYGKSWEPYSFKGIKSRLERGESADSATTGFFGFMPPPSFVGHSKAEELAYTLASRDWRRGPRTSGDFERYNLVQKFQHKVQDGTLDMKELNQAWQSRKIQDTDLAKIYGAKFGETKFLRDFKELKLPDALAVMREANPSERVQLKALLLEKYGQLEKYPLDQQQSLDKQIRGYLQ